MTNEEIIDGLKFTMEMCLYNPTDGSMRPVSTLNDMDKTTYDACEGAIKLLEQQRWIPVSERLPEIGQRILVTYNQEDEVKIDITNYSKHGFFISVVIAWQPLPQPYKAESEGTE